ncbi:hypothetical protein G7Y89_g7386 [Cudoniella acicularis]|uniref:DUF6594 domain-containing protein n=1 Tax=Cudoniella acicularis TaxID=354080 RepID=A0A8H4RIK1_9HELO|nr:hypothetical protein G7Y89_g7386 [Cudoniella acicularis]
MLEQRLEQVDQQEKCLLFLGKSRCDKNADRASLLSELETSLADYDNFAERTCRVLSFGPAQRRDVESLQNWLEGTGCLAREETAYLTQHQELISLAPVGDNAVMQLEAWVEDKLIRFYRGFRNKRLHDVSTDENVYIYSGSMIKRTPKVLLLFLITLLLLMPVVICNVISTNSIRIIIIIASTISYLLILSMLTKSRTMELIIAGATYATILIVFISAGDVTAASTVLHNLIEALENAEPASSNLIKEAGFSWSESDLLTCRQLFRKIVKGFDEKYYALAQAGLRIKQLEARVEQLEPRKRRKVQTSPNSKFADIQAIKKAQIEAGDREIDEDESNSSIESIATSDCIEVRDLSS